MTRLIDKKCVACGPGSNVHKLDAAQVALLAPEVPEWRAAGERLTRTFRFADFAAAMKFVNTMAGIAEAEQHHPDFAVHYNRVEVTLWTHDVGGLHENDFIVAAKIDHALARA